MQTSTNEKGQWVSNGAFYDMIWDIELLVKSFLPLQRRDIYSCVRSLHDYNICQISLKCLRVLCQWAAHNKYC